MPDPQPIRHWIPPASLATSLGAQGVAWGLLAFVPWPERVGLSLPALAWIHTVALGWLTMTALGILVHVIPGFLDLSWAKEAVARWSLLPFGLGAATMVGGFLGGWPGAIATGATLAVLGLAGYLVPAFWTLGGHRPGLPQAAPLKPAFMTVLGLLALAATFGWLMATALAGAPWSRVLVWMPPAHAVLGGLGWLSMLVLGVSTRPLFPVTGHPRVPLRWHRHVSMAFSLGGLLLLVGLWGPLAWAAPLGLLALSASVGLYAADVLPLLVRGRNPHHPPKAFIGSALAYFGMAVAIGWGVWAGQPWQAALAFVGLSGWLGQSVNGYALHIGVRLLCTVVRGPDDETPPFAVVPQPLAWSAFGLFQAALLMGTTCLLTDHGSWLRMAGGLGLLGWAAWMGCLIGAVLRLRSRPLDPTPRHA